MNNFSDRQMFDVDLDCAKCSTHISQLPFQPSGDRPVYCSECNREFRNSRRPSSGGGNFQDRGPRKMFDVDISCADCGTHISQLPFLPKGSSPVYCKDCMMARKSA